MKSLILFGFKSVGKTTLGKRFSLSLGLPFIDTDDLLVARYQKTVRELYRDGGEDLFRKREKEIILSLDPQPAVIALGGGAVLDKENLSHLQTIGQLIYLKANFETVKKRIFSQSIPSFIDPQNPEDSLRGLYEKRVALYEQIPALVIEVELLDRTRLSF